MKKIRNFALLMLLFFSLSGLVGPGTGTGCGQLLGEMGKISRKTHREMRPGRKFRVSVRACDEQTFQSYREVLKEMGFKIDHTWVNKNNHTWVSEPGWRFDAGKDDEDEDLEIRCNIEWVGGEGKKELMIVIYSKSLYFPERPKHYKERIHQKVLERLKIQAK